MNEEQIGDLWQVAIEHLPNDKRDNVATDFINVLMDHGIKESTLVALKGVDPHLDGAIEYAIDDEEGLDEYFD